MIISTLEMNVTNQLPNSITAFLTNILHSFFGGKYKFLKKGSHTSHSKFLHLQTLQTAKHRTLILEPYVNPSEQQQQSQGIYTGGLSDLTGSMGNEVNLSNIPQFSQNMANGLCCMLYILCYMQLRNV